MLPFVAAGVAAGGVSYLVGLPLAYAAFLAVALVAVAIGVTSALTVKVPQVEPKPRKIKVDKSRRNSTPSSSTTTSEDAGDNSPEKPEKAEKPEDNKTEAKATLSKRDKERAKKAAKKAEEEKQKQAEADRIAAEEKQKEAAAKAAQKAAQKATEDAGKERLAALEAAEGDEGEDAAVKKNKKKKKKKTTEEKKNVDSTPAPAAAKPSASETKTASKTTAPAKKTDDVPAKKTEVKKTETSSKKTDTSKPTEVKPIEQPVAEKKVEEKHDTKSAPVEDEDNWQEAKKTGKKNKRETPAVATDAAAPEQKVEITIDPKNFGVIIGKAGATMKLITDATQTHIDMSSKDAGKITVSGPNRESIDKAIDAINQLASKGYSVLTHGRRDEGSIVVPPAKRFNVIGPNGSTVKLIQEKLKVRINLPDRSSSDSTVTVTGDNADVQEALKCIAELIDQGYSDITHPGCVKEVIEVPAGQLGSIIGARGSSVRDIQERTGAKINIEGTSVTVVGQHSQVAEAKNKIAQLLAPVEPLPADPEWSREASSQYVDLW